MNGATTLKSWLRGQSLSMVATLIEQRTDRVSAEEWDRAATHWHCTLRHVVSERAAAWEKRGARKVPVSRVMAFEFSQGAAHTAPPTLADVLPCVVSDAQGVESASGDFDTWASDYGLDSDSIQARETFEACARQWRELQRVLGAELAGELARVCESDPDV